MNTQHFKIIIIILGISILLISCGQNIKPVEIYPTVETEVQSTTESSLLDNNNKIEYDISAQEGEVLSVPCGDNSRIDISLPPGSMKNDVTLELTPLENNTNEDWISAGFHLNEEGKSGVELQIPAGICYVTTVELPENAIIVKWDDDGKGYEPISSQRFKTSDAFGLIAYVDSFSAYGVKTVTDAELREMSDELEKKGFNWELEVDDRDGFSDEYVSYEAYLNMILVNSEGPSPFVMSGYYNGFATMQSKATVTIEGTPLGFSLVEAKDDTASFNLYPVFEQYLPEPGSGLAPLSGLVPIRYEGEGVFHMRNPIDLGGVASEDGINVMEVARQFEAEWGMDLPEMTEEVIPFTVVTDGPVAYLEMHVSNGAIIKLVGSIVGYSKEQRPKIVPLTEEQKSKPPTPKTKTTQYQDESGTIHYDVDGDGQTDFSLFPLNFK